MPADSLPNAGFLYLLYPFAQKPIDASFMLRSSTEIVRTQADTFRSQSSKHGHWLTHVCYSTIMFLYITSVMHTTSIIIVPFVTVRTAGFRWEGEFWRFKVRKAPKKKD